MEVIRILESYSDATLDQLSADKVDEAANLRLPRPVITQEIAAALGSLTYVANALALRDRPLMHFSSYCSKPQIIQFP